VFLESDEQSRQEAGAALPPRRASVTVTAGEPQR